MFADGLDAEKQIAGVIAFAFAAFAGAEFKAALIRLISKRSPADTKP